MNCEQCINQTRVRSQVRSYDAVMIKSNTVGGGPVGGGDGGAFFLTEGAAMLSGATELRNNSGVRGGACVLELGSSLTLAETARMRACHATSMGGGDVIN